MKEDSAIYWKMMMASCFCDDSFDHRHASCPFSCIYWLQVCVFLVLRLILAWMKKLMVKGKFWLPPNAVSFDEFLLHLCANIFVLGSSN